MVHDPSNAADFWEERSPAMPPGFHPSGSQVMAFGGTGYEKISSSVSSVLVKLLVKLQKVPESAGGIAASTGQETDLQIDLCSTIFQ